MPDPLAQLRSEIDERLRALQPLRAEAARLDQALTALDETQGAAAESPMSGQRVALEVKPLAVAPPLPPPAVAPPLLPLRGRVMRAAQPQKAVIDYLTEHNSGTAGEIAEAKSMSRTSLTATLSKLRAAGVLRKADRGYAIGAQPAAPSS